MSTFSSAMNSGIPEFVLIVLFLFLFVIATVPNYIRRHGPKAYAMYFAFWITVVIVWIGVSSRIVWP